MLMVIDVGNTNIVFGVYEGDKLVREWRIGTVRDRTSDEYGVLLRSLYATGGVEPAAVKDAIIASVVPPLTNTIADLCRTYFKIDPMIVGPGVKTGMPILYDSPREVGADRIVNAVAAFELFKAACVVVDFGTATTFDYVSERGEYVGGAIAPGVTISIEALFQRASKLPRVELVKPKKVIGKNTVASIQSGIIYGYVGLVDGLVDRIREENAPNARVIATGGLATLIAPESRTIEQVIPQLTLDGLRLIHAMNRSA
ncbi:MAG: type III pantothenate kinase [Candidatus Methylomirabilis sp.]|nr:type III pantothenate kinase [Deltaproteobacteria bacterium]